MRAARDTDSLEMHCQPLQSCGTERVGPVGRREEIPAELRPFPGILSDCLRHSLCGLSRLIPLQTSFVTQLRCNICTMAKMLLCGTFTYQIIGAGAHWCSDLPSHNLIT